MNLLQEYLFIPLDIFRRNLQNKGIENDLAAWLTFLSVDEPEMICQLLEKYPRFRPMYEQIYGICKNMEKVIGLYSEELLIMDRNTVQLMIDEQQEEIEKQREQIKERDDKLKEWEDKFKEWGDTMETLLKENAELKSQLAEKK